MMSDSHVATRRRGATLENAILNAVWHDRLYEHDFRSGREARGHEEQAGAVQAMAHAGEPGICGDLQSCETQLDLRSGPRQL